MNVLIAFECSGRIREEFRRRGHNAWSCDLKPAEDGSPYHIQGDAIAAIIAGCPDGGKWDLVIAHPPCTRLSNSGVLRLYKGGKKVNGIDFAKWEDMRAGAKLFGQTMGACTHRGIPCCLENPIQHGHAIGEHGCGRPDQIIQPHDFGDDASKATALWLVGLPMLRPTSYFPPRMVNGKPRWSNQTDSGQNRLAPSPHRAADRARTYPGIAAAMAAQWTQFLK